jgi:selenocysteine-specific elongation factor
MGFKAFENAIALDIAMGGSTNTILHLLAIAQNRFFLPETLAELAAIARQLAAEAEDGCFDAAAYRDASGIGRNLTIDVLEFLDRAGITRYAGDRRSIIG